MTERPTLSTGRTDLLQALDAARAMLKALKELADAIDAVDENWDSGGGRDLAGAVNNLDADVARRAIKLAEDAGITTGE